MQAPNLILEGVKLCSGEKAIYSGLSSNFLLQRVLNLKFDKIKFIVQNNVNTSSEIKLKSIDFGMWSDMSFGNESLIFVLPESTTISYESKICNSKIRLSSNFDLSQLK